MEMTEKIKTFVVMGFDAEDRAFIQIGAQEAKADDYEQDVTIQDFPSKEKAMAYAWNIARDFMGNGGDMRVRVDDFGVINMELDLSRVNESRKILDKDLLAFSPIPQAPADLLAASA